MGSKHKLSAISRPDERRDLAQSQLPAPSSKLKFSQSKTGIVAFQDSIGPLMMLRGVSMQDQSHQKSIERPPREAQPAAMYNMFNLASWVFEMASL